MTPKPHGALQPAPGLRRWPALLAALAFILLVAAAARAGRPSAAAASAALAAAPPLLPPSAPCTDLQALLEGSWGVRLSRGAPPQLLAWQPPPAPACLGALPGPALLPLAALRGRALALVGDSVSRYLFVDLAVELCECEDALGWDGVACAAGGGGGGGGGGGSPACSALHSFACAGKRHEDLLLSDPASRTTLHLVWATTAEGLTRGSFPGVLAGAYDGIAVSVGLWDVAIKSEGEAYSLQHHCAWMHSHVQAALAQALARAPALAQRLVFWQPPFTEPLNGNHLRIPRSELEVANGCTAAGLAGAGLALANTSALLGAPPAAFEELLAAEAADPAQGALLTHDGYHPLRRVRAVLLNALLQYFFGVWEAGDGDSEARLR